MKYSRIAGTGSCLPSKVLTNKDLEKIVDTDDKWIVERTGIKERRILGEGENITGLAEVATKRALEAANMVPNDIDLILLATTTPDRTFPSNAVLLQERLGIAECPAFDIAAACAGFNYGLVLADNFIRVGQAKNVLVLGAEALSRIVDWTDRSTCILFGDGVGAVIFSESDEPGIVCSKISAAGKYKDLLYAPTGLGPDAELSPKIAMAGSAVFKVAVNTLGKAVLDVLEKSGMEKSDIDWLVPHQANLRIIQAVAKKLDLTMDKVIITLDKQGNTSSASVPLALDQAIREGKIKRGDNILLESFGGGFTWGSAIIRY